MKKRLLLLMVTVLLFATTYAQQAPITESYFVNKYALSPSYAGNSENGYIVRQLYAILEWHQWCPTDLKTKLPPGV